MYAIFPANIPYKFFRMETNNHFAVELLVQLIVLYDFKSSDRLYKWL